MNSSTDPSRGDVRALVLAGGASRRMGRHKPAIEIGGTSMIARVLAAAAAYRPVVVGLPQAVPDGVMVIPDAEPGAGPVAAIATGLSGLRPRPERVLVLAADLPRLTAAHLAAVAAAIPVGGCAITVSEGREQWLCAGWDMALLASRLASEPAAGRSMRSLYAGLEPVRVADRTGVSFDVDTPDDLAAIARQVDGSRGCPGKDPP